MHWLCTARSGVTSLIFGAGVAAIIMSYKYLRLPQYCIISLMLMILLPYDKVGHATGIKQLLVERVAIPTTRPEYFSDQRQPRSSQKKQATSSDSGKVVSVKTSRSNVTPATGNLRQGLEAIGNKKINKARSIRLGMRAGSLDRKILAWSIALSSQKGIPSAEIAAISRDLSTWPGQAAMINNSEAALAREGLSARNIITTFGKQKPQSLTGAILLSKAHLELGNKKAARKIIAPFWHRKKLSKNAENDVLKKVGAALNVNDHRTRMHYMFYRDRATAANRIASRSEQMSLARARSAVVKRSKDAGKKLSNVAASWRKDPGYIFAKVQYLRRAGDIKKAAKLLASAPRNADKLIHPDEWWVERRIISRALLDLGNAKLAYKLAAEHSAQSRTKRAEAEFHAGWYALRYLKNKQVARKHFSKILNISSTPISQARGYYWLAGTHSGATASKYYKAAARHQGTYYGQLAAVKLGKRKLSVRPKKPSGAERAKFKSREMVKAISKLEANGSGWRADIIYRHLAKKLSSAGEISLLSARAEKQGKPTLALQIGKIAYRRGLPVITSSWPLGAIPTSAKIGNAGRALAYSIARQESAFDHRAVSPANARGLLQLLPGTAKLMAKKTKVAYSFKKLTRDPAYNARLGSAYLSEQLSKFDGSYILTFAGYNAGPGRAKKWIAKYGDPRGMSLDKVIDWVERIPFTETRNYVQRVMENMQIYQARISNSRLQIDKDLVHGRR